MRPPQKGGQQEERRYSEPNLSILIDVSLLLCQPSGLAHDIRHP